MGFQKETPSEDHLLWPSLVAKTVANNPYDFDALDKAYCDYYDSGSFDSGPTFEKVHELMANGYKRSEAVLETHKRLNGSTAGCNPMHRFAVVAGLDIPYKTLDRLARNDAALTLRSRCRTDVERDRPDHPKDLESYSLIDSIGVTNELNLAERKILQTTPSPGIRASRV